MALLVGDTTGNISTLAANRISNSPTINASTNINITSGGVSSLGFTAPSLLDSSLGVLIYGNLTGTSGTITAKLQLSGVDVPGATITINLVDYKINSWNYFKWAAPVAFTSLTASAYTIRMNVTSASGTIRAAADSGGSNIAFVAVDSRTATPTDGDELFLVSPNNTADVTFTVDTTTCQIGDAASTTAPSGRELTNALYINNKAILKYSRVANSKYQVKGNIFVYNGGTVDQGTEADPIDAFTSTLEWNQNGTTVSFGYVVLAGGKWYQYGTEKILKGLYDHGVGTAADPFTLTTAVSWNVNDKIAIAAASNDATNYNQVEERFIKTVVSPTEYVLSTTVGGAEAALTFTHFQNARVINLTNSVIVTTTSTSMYWYGQSRSNTAGDVIIAYASFQNIGSQTTSKFGFQLVSGTTQMRCNLDHVAFDNVNGTCFALNTTIAANTFTDLVIYNVINGTTSTGVISTFSGCKNQTLGATGSGVYILKVNRCAIGFTVNANIVYNDLEINAANYAGLTTARALYIVNSALLAINGLALNCSRYPIGISGATASTVRLGEIGTLGENKSSTAHVIPVTETYNTIVFENCSFGSNLDLYQDEELMINESYIAFFRLDEDDNYHKIALVGGEIGSAGAGLPDTTTQIAGSKSVYFAPNGSGEDLFLDFFLPTRVNGAPNAVWFGRINSSFTTGTFTGQLFLPEQTTPSSTFTFGTTQNSWLVMSVAATYTGTTEEVSLLRINVNCVDAGARAYIDTFYNATIEQNPVATMDVWNKGFPVNVLIPQAGDPLGVWAVAQSIVNVNGTMGQRVLRLLEEGNFIALKDS
jgi:hypothetical protein